MVKIYKMYNKNNSLFKFNFYIIRNWLTACPKNNTLTSALVFSNLINKIRFAQFQK